MIPWTEELRKRLGRPDPKARVIVEAEVVTRADSIHRKDHWADADTTTGFRRLDDGRLTLAPTTASLIGRAAGANDATALARVSPFVVGAIEWVQAGNSTIHSISARLDPDTAGTGKVVKEWAMQLYLVTREESVGGARAIMTAPVSQVVYVTAGASATDVTFPFPAGQEPVPARWGAPEVQEGLPTYTFGDNPVTLVHIWAIDGEGNAAGNVAWIMDDATDSFTGPNGNILRSYSLTQVDTGQFVFSDRGSTPWMEVIHQTFTAATLSFTTNRLDLGALPAGEVRFEFEESEPAATSVLYEVLADDGTTWVAVESGQTTDDLPGVGKRQTYAIRATLDPGSPANQTPAIVSVAVKEVSLVDFDGLAQVNVSGWQVDPQTHKGSICEATIRALQDGNRDYRDAATALVAENSINDIAFRVWVGWKDADGKIQGRIRDIFDIDDHAGEGAARVFTCVGRNARLANIALPVYDTAAKQRERLAYENQTLKAVWDDILTNQIALDDRFIGPGVEDATTQVTKRIEDSEAITELDAIAYIAGGSVVSSQGRIRFVDLHAEGREVVHIFRREDIQPGAIGPGLRGRVPEFYVPWDYDFDAKDFAKEAQVVSSNALLSFDPWRIDGPRTLEPETAKWIDTAALAEAVGNRVVETQGTGLILWPFESLYPTGLEPGDVVAVPTDRFAARDPNVARALKGQVYAIGRIVRVGDVMGTDLVLWVQSYADIRGASTTITRRGFVDAAITDVFTKEQTETTVTKAWTVNEECDEVWLYTRTVAQDTVDPWPDTATVVPTTYAAGTTTQHTFTLPAANQVTYVILEPRGSLLFSGEQWRMEIHPLDAEYPEIETDDSETATVGTQWVKVTARGLGVTSVQFQTKVGNHPPTAFGGATRVAGGASVVRGGTLGAGEYEHDVTLATDRFSWIIGKATLDTGEVIILGPFGFDRNKQPDFLSVRVSGKIVQVGADTDTKSIKLERVDGGGTWVQHRDRQTYDFDVAASDDSGNLGIGAGQTWTLRVTAYSDPKVDAGASSLTTTQDVTVSDGGSTHPLWLSASASAPAAGSADATITLHANANGKVITDYETKVFERLNEGAGWTAFSDVTASLSPALTTPPTTSTSYTRATRHTRISGAHAGEPLVQYEWRCEIRLIATGAVVETETVAASWYTDSPVPE